MFYVRPAEEIRMPAEYGTSRGTTRWTCRGRSTIIVYWRRVFDVRLMPCAGGYASFGGPEDEMRIIPNTGSHSVRPKTMGPTVLLSALFFSCIPVGGGAYEPVDSSPSWATYGAQIYSYYGWSVSCAGDVNNDGYDDVIVGAPAYNNGQGDEGLAFVYHGGPSGLSSTGGWVAESDQTGALFGWDVSTAGDVNKDGYDDVIVSAHYYDNGDTEEGRVYVFHGGPSGVDSAAAWTVESDQERARFGNCVGNAGDVNGDGYADVIVGSLDYDHPEENEGRAFVYLGSASGLDTVPAWSAESNQAFSLFGYSVASAGDVNADGYSDIIVGARRYANGQDNEGRVYAFYGSETGPSATADWVMEEDNLAALFGNCVACAGDVNGDGYSDVIIGSPNYSNGEGEEGRVSVYNGGPSGLSATPSWTAESNQVHAHMGRECFGAGDVNADGYSDVVVGAYEYDLERPDQGRAYVYLGGPSGLSRNPAWIGEGDQPQEKYGKSVGCAGDVDGDGDSEVIVGAHRYTGDLVEEGAAYVYAGNSQALGISAAANLVLFLVILSVAGVTILRRAL
jgi:hypothetical protein